MKPEHRIATREELLDSINKLVLEKQVAIEALKDIAESDILGRAGCRTVAMQALEKLKRP